MFTNVISLTRKIDVMEDIDSVLSNVQSARQEALLFVFEDNEAVIKMIIKGRSPTMRHVSRTHRVALDWLFDRINLDSKIQIKYIDTKNQLADILTKGNFTRDEWNHLLSLFNISHFSSTICSAAMAKRIQQESGEERVTAKSRPMMNLTARMPSIVSSSTSSNPGKTWYGYQDPGKSVVEDDRSGKLDRLSPAGYSKVDFGRSWSSQEWKSEATAHDRSGKLDETSWNAMQQVLMAATMNAATFMGKNFMDIQNSIMNSRDLTLKKMFDITLKLVSEQDEINNLDKIHWGRNSWKQLSLIGDETVINVFSDSVLCLGRIHQHLESNEARKKRIEWITTDQSYRDYDGINGEPTEFELSDLGKTFTGRILFMSMFNDISCDRKGSKEECLANARVVKVLAKRFGIGQMVIYWSRF